MERLTYVTEDGEILFHPEDLPEDEGMTTGAGQRMKDGKRWIRLPKSWLIWSRWRNMGYW